MISIELTNHINRGSVCESSDNCNTCDGANCDTCSKKYIVQGKHFDELKEAEEFEELFNKTVFFNNKWYEAEEDMKYNCTVIDGVLYTQIYDNGHHIAEVNKDFPLYDEYMKSALEKCARFNQCTKEAKNEQYYGNCCGTLKRCNNVNCYRDMCNGGGIRFFD